MTEHFTLTLSRDGDGAGNVSSSPSGVDCGTDCSESLSSGTLFTLTATPAAGSSFTGWSGACTGTGNCVVTMDAAKSVTATFSLNTYVLSVATSGNGTGAVTGTGVDCGTDCSETLAHGTLITLTATPAAGSSFTGWSGACTGTGNCVVTMDAAKSVTATFSLNTYILSVSKSGSGAGTVSGTGIDCGADCSETLAHGTLITLTATPSAGSTFTGWSGACAGTGGCVVTMDAAKSVTATFSLNTYVLSVVTSGNGTGAVTGTGIDCGADCSETLAHGTLITLTATPSAGSSFTGWSGACAGTGGCVVTMDAAKSVTATFALNSYVLSVSKSGSGTGTVTGTGIDCGADCSESLGYGTIVTLTATPSAGSSFTGWTGACAGTGSCVVTMDAAKSVNASFTAMTPLLTVTSSGTGVGAVMASVGAINCGATCSSTYAHGTLVTLTATPEASSLFEGWTGACSGTETCVVSMDAAKSVGAIFTRRSYPLVVVKSGAGSGTVTVTSAGGEINCGTTCSATLTHGTRRTLMATPAAGSLFVGWTGDCAGRTFPSCIVTMNGPKAVGVEFAPSSYPLTVTRSGDGAGTVTANVGVIDCGANCSNTYAPNAVVTLTATPAANMSFTGWTGACSGTGTCTVTMNEARSVDAAFATIRHVVTINKIGAGGGKIGASSGTLGVAGSLLDCESSCSITYAAGLSISLSAQPNTGSRFLGWSGPCSGLSNCNLTIDGPKSVTVNFGIEGYPLTIVRDGPGMITSHPAGIDCGGDCAETVPHGSRITLTATPDAHATFVRWTDACLGTTGPVCELDMPASTTAVGAVFAWETYDVTVTRTGAGDGTVTSDWGDINCGAVCGDTYSRNDDITLTATAAPGSVFVGWSGPCTGTGTCLVPMTQAWAVEARFIPVMQTLTVSRTGSGVGAVTADVGGINCGAQCGGSYSFGTSVTLTATAEPGSTFVSWSGACSGESSDVCTVSVTEAPTVTARFDQQGHTVTVMRTGTGTGTVSTPSGGVDCGEACNASYTHGAVVTFTAAAATGSTFGGWSGACSGTGSCVVTVDEAKTVTASFTSNSYAVSVTRTGAGNGVVIGSGIDCGSTCGVTVAHGTTVSLTATPSAGSSFAGWSGPCSGTGSCTVSVASALSVVAQFDRLPHLVSVTRAGAGSGTVLTNISGIDCGDDCSESYAHGTTVVLMAVPGTGSTFAGWSGPCSGTSNCTLTVDDARDVTATFGLVNHILAAIIDGPGVITSVPSGIDCGGDCAEVLPHGTSVTLTATANPGGSFVGWSGDCAGQSTSVCTLAVTGSPTTAGASFAWNRYDVAVTRTGNGAGRVVADQGALDCGAVCSDDYGHGDTVTLTATAEPGSVFVGWSGACSGSGSCVVSVTQASVVQARFTTALQSLAVVRDGGGSGTVTADVGTLHCGSTCSGSYTYGTSVTLTATADAGSTFAGWSGACSGETTNSCIVDIDESNEVTASFARLPYLLTVSLDGDGTGDVYSAPGGISCGSDCSEALAPTTVVELTAAAASDSVFDGWTGACSGTGSCFVTMDGARSVTATFDKKRHLLAVTRTGAGAAEGTISATLASGTGTATIVTCGDDCNELVPHGGIVTLTASGGAGASFTGWSGGGCTGVGSCTVSITAAANVTASFAVRTYTVSVSRSGNASMGRVVSSPAGLDCGTSCTGQFAYGTTMTLTAQPEANGTFAGWLAGPCTGTTGACTFTVTKQESIDADFRPISHPLTMSIVGTGSGSIRNTSGVALCHFGTCALTVSQGNAYTYVAAPDSTMVFAGWEGGSCSGTGNCVVSVSGPATVTARFNRPDESLSLSKAGSGGGRVISNPSGIDCGSNCVSSFAYGTNVTLTASPDATSIFEGWSSDCSDISIGVCVTTLTAARSIVATFTPKPYTLSVTTTGSGTVTKSGSSFNHGSVNCSSTAGNSTSCSATVRHGDTVTLGTITPAIGTFLGWGGACSGTGGCTLSIGGPASVSATFATRTHTVSVSANGGGLGDFSLVADGNINTLQRCTERDCSYSYAAGTNLEITASAKTGVTFSGWSGGCSGTDAACTFTVMSDSAATATFDAAPNIAFVTSTTHTGNLGGLSGADSICQARASAAGLSGNFLAYLTTSVTTAYSRVSSAAGWVRTDGRPVASTAAAMQDGFMFLPIRVDEFGNDVGAERVMTGSTGGGLGWSNHCNSWNSSSPLEGRYVGYADAVGDDAFSATVEMGCSSPERIYCFQIDRQAYVAAEPVASYRLAFRSSTAIAADAGLDAADALCQSDADAAGLGGSYRALMASDGASAASRFDTTGAPWARRDGTLLAATALALFTDAYWNSAVIETAAATQTSLSGTSFWTGAPTLTAAGTAATTCDNWRSTTGTSAIGEMNRTHLTSMLTSASSNCSSARPVLCLEE